MKKIGLLLISTNKYGVFVQPLIDSIIKYFLPDSDLLIHLFTDNVRAAFTGNERVKIIKHQIPSYGFPHATLYRYKVFLGAEEQIKECSHLFYMDVDMKIVAPVGNEILNDITAVLHPGFYNGGGGWEMRVESKAYYHPRNMSRYFAGGFQGGETESYIRAVKTMSDNIDEDERNGIVAVWHDESHWNAYLSKIEFTVLDPSYCMVEQEDLQKLWRIAHFEPKIIALAKEHDKIRN